MHNHNMDSHSISLTKGLSWRIIGTIDTILISYIITGHFPAAFSIGAIEVFTKVFLYYLHERLWLKISWGRDLITNKNTHLRSVIKGINWRLIGTIDTILISFLITGHLTLALKIGAIELFTKIFLYYLHERFWNWFVNRNQGEDLNKEVLQASNS